ncbi:MAG: 3-octaprenyl-4-hydroxybenzoate carboxy-lyase, partial [Candidatus Eremiobacterota bacterium]
IHELTGPVLPAVLPGVQAIHAVDAAGVHPLLLAVASERYTPYEARRRPQELLTIANALLGHGQLSLAKYLFLAAREDDPYLDLRDVQAFLQHVLARVDLARDLHFQTCTTIDTLDYSGGALHEGSKLVVACCGPPVRELGREGPDLRLPDGFRDLRVCFPGVLAVEGPGSLDHLCSALEGLAGWPLVVAVDDSHAVSRRLDDFLWTVFTRSNPAVDVRGAGEFVRDKHWGCAGPLVIDARAKPHHAAVLEEDPDALRTARGLAAPGGPLHGVY